MTSSEIVHSARARLGPVGVWLGVLGRAPIDEERRAARRIDALGYGSIWTPEGIGGKEAFAHQLELLAATQRIATGTGIANVWARHPATMQGGAATLGAAYPGRFVLGVGISHAPAVERSGQEYVKPLQHMARYLDGMDAAAETAPATEVPVPRVLAALRPNMLALARDRADGAHPYFVPVAHTPIARDRLVDAIVAWGDAADVARRVREHLDGGADHVLLQPLGDLNAAVRQLERLATAVLGH